MENTQVQVSSAILAQAEKIIEQQKARLEKTRENLTKYPHALPHTLRFDPVTKKNQVEIECIKCSEKRWVYTSDLFQVRHCMECAKEAKADKKKARAAEMKEALAIVQARKQG